MINQSTLTLKENEIKNYFGRKVAIDASMSLYQFLIAVRQVNTDAFRSDPVCGCFLKSR